MRVMLTRFWVWLVSLFASTAAPVDPPGWPGLAAAKAKAARIRRPARILSFNERRHRSRLGARAKARRQLQAKLRSMTHLYPPQEGSRRPEFSSKSRYYWSAEHG